MRSEKIVDLFPEPDRGLAGSVPRWSAQGLIGLWLLVVVPMAGLSLFLAPVLIARHPEMNPGLIFWGTIITGMAWQFLVSLGVLVAEGQRWTWPDIRRSLWLVPPSDPVTGRATWSALWLVVPMGAVFVFATDVAFGWLDGGLAGLLPAWLTPEYGTITDLATPANTGNWAILWLALLSSLFNYVLGEALFFHGILLPRMVGVFGRWAWVANAIAFGCYHVHKAAVWPTVIISCLAYSLPSQYMRSIWPAVLIHGVEGLVLIGAVLFVVLGGMQ
jgi:uncharacterized protein